MALAAPSLLQALGLLVDAPVVFGQEGSTAEPQTIEPFRRQVGPAQPFLKALLSNPHLSLRTLKRVHSAMPLCSRNHNQDKKDGKDIAVIVIATVLALLLVVGVISLCQIGPKPAV